MKRYALRKERAESVLGYIAHATVEPSKLQQSYDAFVATLVEALYDCAREPVHVDVHAFEDLEERKARLRRPGLAYISLDSQSEIDTPFGVSRRFDFRSGEQLGLTSRPGFDELDEQIAQLKRTLGATVGIVEDDIYTGGTLRHLIARFAAAGITVGHIVSGIASCHAIEEVPVDAAAYYEPRELLELTDPRDYVYGARQGGLVVSYFGQKFRVPYDAAFVDMPARSSLEPQKAPGFSGRLRRANAALHAALGTDALPAVLFYPLVLLREYGMGPGNTLGQFIANSSGRYASPVKI